jgi:DNA-binding transcriptional ArsR family regulator
MDDATAILRASAHPLRLRILSILTGTSMSAAELARELGTTQANASYHLRVLAQAGEVVPDGEESIRGGVAKRYRHPWRELRDDKDRPVGDMDQHVRAMGQELRRRYASRKPRTSSVMADAEMWVSPETWAEVHRLVREASTLIHAEARAPRSEGSMHVNLQVAAFQMEDPS